MSSTATFKVPTTEVTETSNTKTLSTTMIPPTTRMSCSKFLNGIDCTDKENPGNLTIKLQSKNKLTGYKISGSDLGFVRSFHLFYKDDSGNFRAFLIGDNNHSLEGNSMESLESTHFFQNKEIVEAKVIRVIATDWEGSSDVGFCFQILGCESEGKATTLVYTSEGITTVTTVSTKMSNQTIITEYVTSTTPRISTSESIESSTPRSKSTLTPGTELTTKVPTLATGASTTHRGTSEKTGAPSGTTGKTQKTTPPSTVKTKQTTSLGTSSSPTSATRASSSILPYGSTAKVTGVTSPRGSTSQPVTTGLTGSPGPVYPTVPTGATSPPGPIFPTSNYQSTSTIPSISTSAAYSTANPSSTSQSLTTTVPLPCTPEDGKITNGTICHECECIEGYWKCKTYCHETCASSEELIQQAGTCCFCSNRTVTPTIVPISTTPHYQCNDDVEIENLPDDHFSSNDGNASNIKFDKLECWSPRLDDAFVQIDLMTDTVISGYRISGIKSGYVKSFTMSFRKVGESQFSIYKDDPTMSPHIFSGNSMEELDISELFPNGKSFHVNSVRILPTDLSSNSVCVKFDLVGCTKISTPSSPVPTITAKSTVTPVSSTPYQCNDDVEIENLPDSSFTSNDGNGSNVKFNKTECWSPRNEDAFVQIDLLKDTVISGYRISGIQSGYVKSFTMSFKKHGESQFVIYNDDVTKSPHIFSGNTKEDLDVNELFPNRNSLLVNSVRIHPKDLSSNSVCVKFDLVGCAKISTPSMSTAPSLSTAPTPEITTVPPSTTRSIIPPPPPCERSCVCKQRCDGSLDCPSDPDCNKVCTCESPKDASRWWKKIGDKCVEEKDPIEENRENCTLCKCEKNKLRCETHPDCLCVFENTTYTVDEKFTPATNSCLSCLCKSKQEGGLFCENLSLKCPEINCLPDEDLVYPNGTCCPHCKKRANPCKKKTEEKYVEINDPVNGVCKSEQKVGLTSCEGKCGASSYAMTMEPPYFNSECNCCKPTLKKKSMKMICGQKPDKRWTIDHAYYVVDTCECRSCAFDPFNQLKQKSRSRQQKRSLGGGATRRNKE